VVKTVYESNPRVIEDQGTQQIRTGGTFRIGGKVSENRVTPYNNKKKHFKP